MAAAVKRCLAIGALVALCSPAVRADVTVTTEVTIEGSMAAMMGGAMPRLIMRVKGTKSRTDVEVMGQSVSTITDVAARQVVVLMPGQKTVQVFDAGREGEEHGLCPYTVLITQVVPAVAKRRAGTHSSGAMDPG